MVSSFDLSCRDGAVALAFRSPLAISKREEKRGLGFPKGISKRDLQKEFPKGISKRTADQFLCLCAQVGFRFATWAGDEEQAIFQKDVFWRVLQESPAFAAVDPFGLSLLSADDDDRHGGSG